MYKFSKLGVLILYPVLNFLVPALAIGTLVFKVSEGASLTEGLAVVILATSLGSLLLLACIIVYLFFVFKRKLFAKQEDGKRKANVADYFATAFAILTLTGMASNLLKLFL